MHKKILIKKAEFRFYEELNDFLPVNRKKKNLIYEFWNAPSVKDAIESFGIPHTEVDLILVNNESKSFRYKLKDQDRVAVYPVFETLDISSITRLRKKPLRKIKFILDVHLGKLARLMRLCGFDVFYDRFYDDDTIIAQALRERRVILTRDIGILKKKIISHGYWVRSTDPKKQITEIINRFDLAQKFAPFSRCLECNSILKPISKNKILHRLQKDTLSFFEAFYWCKHCDKIYWQGSHFEKLKNEVRSVVKLSKLIYTQKRQGGSYGPKE